MIFSHSLQKYFILSATYCYTQSRYTINTWYTYTCLMTHTHIHTSQMFGKGQSKGMKFLLQAWPLSFSMALSNHILTAFYIFYLLFYLEYIHLIVLESSVSGVRGHFYRPTSQMEYVHLNTLNTFCFSNSPYVPPFHQCYDCFYYTFHFSSIHCLLQHAWTIIERFLLMTHCLNAALCHSSFVSYLQRLPQRSLILTHSGHDSYTQPLFI